MNLTNDNREQLTAIVNSLVLDYGALAVQITHTARSNLSWRYRVFWLHTENGRAHLTPITYLVAKVFGEKLTERAELRSGGGGFDRHLEPSYRLMRHLEAEGLLNHLSDNTRRELIYTARRVDL